MFCAVSSVCSLFGSLKRALRFVQCEVFSSLCVLCLGGEKYNGNYRRARNESCTRPSCRYKNKFTKEISEFENFEKARVDK